MKRIDFSRLQVIKHKVITERTISDFYNYIVDAWIDRGMDSNCNIFPLNRGDLLRACKILSDESSMVMSKPLKTELMMNFLPYDSSTRKTFEDIIREKIGE